MALINLLTNLNSFYQDNPFHKEYKGSDSSTPPDAIARGSFDQKSFKFEKDRRGGGSSNQPYIQTPIPERLGEFGYLNQDFILRGGSRALTDSASDVVRLGKYFTDMRNPSGLLFVVKQNLLSRMAVRTQASTGFLNEGIYTPLSTLTEAGGVAFGLHVNKQGLNPFGGVGGISTYSDTIRLATNESVFESHDRLSVLYGYKILNDESTLSFLNGIKVDSGGENILSYRGGPGSILGIGNTNIKFAGSSASERTGANNPLLKTNKEFFLGKEKTPSTQYLNKEGEYKNLPDENVRRFLGLSLKFDELGFFLVPGVQIISSTSVISPIVENNTTNLLNPNNNKTVTFTAGQISLISSNTLESENFPGESRYINNINGPNPTTIPGDFRVNLRRNRETLQKDQETVGNVANAPNYITQNIELRTSLGNPGNRTGKKLTSYTSGSDGSGAASLLSYDIINASEIGDKNNDLVNFTIKAIDNNNPTSTTNIQFRAFLNQISDSYTAEWNSTKYVGRGENLYTYGGFDRKVSLSWTVAAQSKVELIPMYKKLNYLASICAPDYSANGYMRGNIVKLTVGGYFYDQPGIITGFSYEMNDDNATWEIGINDEGGVDNSVKQLPHLIKVNGFNFIPIHTFTPKKVGSITNTQQRYIALENSLKGNSYSLPPQKPKPSNLPNLQNQQNLYTGPDSSEIQPNNNLS